MAALVLVVAIGLLMYADRRHPSSPSTDDDPTAPDEGTVRAFALRPALILAAVITATVLLSRWASGQLGGGGAIGIAAIAGLADGHAGAVSAASLAAHGDISVQTAVWAAGASIGTNTLVKMALAAMFGGVRFGSAFALRMLPAAAAFAITLTVL